MIHHSVYYFYILSLLFASACSIYRFKRLDTASRILSLLICSAFINEGAAFCIGRIYHNNLPLYTFYCFFEFGMLCLYFNNVIDVFIKKNIGIYIGIAGIMLGIINVLFIQHLDTLNSYFLFFEGLSVIAMSLFAFFRLLLKFDSLDLYKYQHFWFISILIFFWCITFLNWGLYDYFNLKLHHEAWKINFGILIAGVITYVSFGCVFLFHFKIQKR